VACVDDKTRLIVRLLGDALVVNLTDSAELDGDKVVVQVSVAARDHSGGVLAVKGIGISSTLRTWNSGDIESGVFGINGTIRIICPKPVPVAICAPLHGLRGGTANLCLGACP
jgi:hypothetical protein